MPVISMRVNEQRQGLVNLCDHVHNLLGDALTIIEIGVYAGDGTKIIADRFPKSRIISVDKWESYEEDNCGYDLSMQAQELKEAERAFDFKHLSMSNVTKIKMDSVEYSKRVKDRSVDFVYIDGCHAYVSVYQDNTHWLPKLVPYGIISGHDFHWATVSRALADIFKKDPDHTFVDGSWMYRMV
jgi:predicted O-methyltransferase YrrM